jgi:hypothetical protein
MKTRLFVSVMFVLAFAASAMAADPIIGTWKLNAAKSNYPPNDPVPKEQVEVYREVGGNKIELTYTQTLADGSSSLYRFQWPLQGGAVKVLQGTVPPGVSWVETFGGSGDWYVIRMQNGKQTAMMHKTISKNGKTMTQRSRITDDQGRQREEVSMFDRQ